MTKDKTEKTNPIKGKALRINEDAPVKAAGPTPKRSSPNATGGGKALKINGPAEGES